MVAPPPHLILCGPQNNSFSQEQLLNLHHVLASHHTIYTSLELAVDCVPSLLERVRRTDPTLILGQSTVINGPLIQWLSSGRLNERSDTLSNTASLPLTVCLQIAQYLQSLKSKGVSSNDYRHVLQDLQQHGAQGFCAGFLTAAAIAFSENEKQLAENVATSVRLAACIGAYVDDNSASGPATVLSARWKQGGSSLSELNSVLNHYPGVSCTPIIRNSHIKMANES